MRKSRFSPRYAHFLRRLKDLRVSKGLGQAEVAERLGVPQQYVSRYETGETRLDVVQFWRYCQALDVSFSSLCRQLEREFGKMGEAAGEPKA